jgi:hypothetical protein
VCVMFPVPPFLVCCRWVAHMHSCMHPFIQCMLALHPSGPVTSTYVHIHLQSC